MTDAAPIIVPEFQRLPLDQRIALADSRGLSSTPRRQRLPLDEVMVRNAWSILAHTWRTERITDEMIASGDPERIALAHEVRRDIFGRARSLLTKLDVIGSA